MSPRPDVSEARRNQILEAATAVFLRLGFLRARMDDIVNESGLSKGTLYWYFKGKDDIIIGIVDRLLRRELDHLVKLKATEGSAKQRLDQIVDLTINDLEKMKPVMPIFYEFLSLALRRKRVQRVFQKYFRSFMEIVVPIVQEGIDRGEFKGSSAEDAAIAISAMIEGTMLLMFYDPGAVKLDKHIKSGFELVIRGMEGRA